ncbi:HipA domain-containing protein [Candidatus Poriferisodalis sp.]|uniref:HipA domain-containing protein n=1 Tax=Candidatus Poriferisodalis sp. TaxID=3101277 RepID=UPI003B012AAB
MSSTLCVVLNGAHAANVEFRGRQAALEYRREYIRQSATPLSARFPLSNPMVRGEEVRRWLLNLLPDDDNVLTYLRSEYKMSGRDPLRLLETPMGADCAGAVQFCLPDRLGDLLSRQGGSTPITDSEIAAWLGAYPVLPPVMDTTGSAFPVTFSLAGMQPKIALRRARNGSWERTWGSLPTTHIIKAARSDYPDECVFEHLTMSTARRLGIPAARTEVADFGGRQAIIVERFDRSSNGMGRIHQEDSCQALGKSQSEKYENLGGPGVADLRRIAQSGGPATSGNVDRLRDMLLYRWLVVDSDAHAKNYSWMFDDAGSVHLAPLYDSCSWLPFRRGMRTGDVPMAMSMGTGTRVSDCDRPEGLAGLAAKLGRPRSEICERAAELADALPSALKDAAAALPAVECDRGSVEEHIAEIDIRASTCEQIAAETPE